MEKETKLIIIRGNSGSGKTVTAKALQKKFGLNTMLISQDVVRREMLYTRDGKDTACLPLILELALYGKRNCKIVILEGILNSRWYKKLFDTLSEEYGDNIYSYYFDIPFEETLKRHRTKPNAHEFGEKEMRSWWNEKDFLGFKSEVAISKDESQEDIVEMIYNQVSNIIKYR